MKKIEYACKENDNVIRTSYYDGFQLEIGDCTKRSFLVIGYKDLKAALKQAGYSVRRGR